MEVKSIFVNNILKAYEKPVVKKITSNADESVNDDMLISPQSSKRLFGEMMEHSLKKSLENK
ncbi:MAG: hypothetical protein JW920_10400 [Deltaproteobacteria bacterium]|nr:hypothetical protein [Deltaproteobacteria bacterium]